MAASSLRPIRRAMYLFLSGGGVELPAVRALHDWDRERPSLVADDEHFLVGSLIDQSPAFRGRHGEDLEVLACGRLIRRGHQLPSIRAENRQEVVQLSRFGRCDQLTNGVFRRGKRSLGGALSRDEERVRHECRTQEPRGGCYASHRRLPPPPLLLPLLRELLRLLCPRVLAERSDCPFE